MEERKKKKANVKVKGQEKNTNFFHFRYFNVELC